MFTTPEMAAVFADSSLVQRMLDVEAALARAEARAGIIPQKAAAAIAARCHVDLFDLTTLSQEAAVSLTPVIPLVRMLTEQVEADARGFVHWGATSQDIVDTAMVLQMRDGLDLLIGKLVDVATLCAALAERYRKTPMAGRTLLQHAVPMTFGLKTARWLSLLTRVVQSLRDLRSRAIVVQLGGAAGTLAALGTHGVQVMELVAHDLGLAVPDMPWHTERDRIADVATALGVIAGAMGKVAVDLALLAQSEVGEVSWGSAPGTRGSSTMPHKRNPTEATAAIASARLAMGIVPTVLASMLQEHERAAGGWQAEWRAIPELFRTTSGAVEWVHRALSTLQIHPDRMQATLELTKGQVMAEALTMALAPRVGRAEAYRIVQQASERASRGGLHLRAVAAVDVQIRAVLSAEQIDQVFDATNYLGSADAFIDRALESFRQVRQAPATRS